MRWIRFHFSEKERGLAIGVYMTGTKIGPAIGAGVAGWLIQAYDWRMMFIILGIGTMLWLIPWTTVVRDDDRRLEKEASQKSTVAAVSFGRIMASPVIWGTIVGTFCYMYFVYFCMTWMPAYFVERRHLSLGSMGLYQFASFGGMATVAALGGWAADRLIASQSSPFRSRFLVNGFYAGFALGCLGTLVNMVLEVVRRSSSQSVAGILLTTLLYGLMASLGCGLAGMAAALVGGGFDRIIPHGLNPIGVRKAFTIAGFLIASTEVIGALSDSISVALFFAVFSLSGLGLATANYWALTQTLIPGGAIGRIVGIQNCAANLPGIVAPLLTGWLKQTTGNYDAPMQAIWFFLLLGVAAYVFLVRQKYAPREARA